MSYSSTAPEGIPQSIWDDAIALWLELSTADSDDIKRIADALMLERKPLEALKLHVAYEMMPRDRGGRNGPRGRAWAEFIAARDAALQGDVA